jgi:uncharacterized RDD family membrane protein YckC
MRAPALDTTAAIEAPEHIRFEVRVAGPARRCLAYLVDLFLRGVIVFIAMLPFVFMGTDIGDEVGEASQGVLLLMLFIVEWGYYALFESIGNGQSPGKKMLGLRVIDQDGRPATFLAIVLRNLLRAADSLPWSYCVGLVVMAADGRFRRLGDHVAGTIVVVEERARVTEPVRIHPAPTEQELATIPAHPDLRGADLDALAAFLRRLGTLSPLREVELAEMIAPVWARRLGVTYEDPVRFLALLYVRATATMLASKSGLYARRGRR